ncbi:SIR2 family NAD-dependent protein deacylase [Lysinibacillus antri]|uniref:protein acetyllysine N-acetyltransferase n=1 Tax=Lysinibacillus antri TaxID=2498145 RepID=A0A432LA68_9BACI|nr:NAD-dependent deacylase [Lysinibacillus antri]RUL50896.1 NAD-dependent deacylase [Lysinibacillus antri]
MNSLATFMDWLKTSQKTVVLTGAGMSTESGIPDFRSSSGWWKNIDPHTVATVTALENKYDLFHEFYSMRLTGLEQCQPHDGHYILADWEKRGFIHSIATQNVDGFHTKAGNKHVQELHGSIQTFRCHQCNESSTKEAFIQKETCQECGGVLRPNVVLFGEALPEESWTITLKNIQQADLVIVIGTSLEVYPVNQLPTMTKGKTVYINKDANPNAAYFDLIIEGKAKETLQHMQTLL